MGYLLCLSPAGWQATADADQTLLQSAERAGWTLPSACRNGTCRACMARVTGGPVAYRIAWPGLSAEEKADGWVLPCVAYPLGPLTLHQTANRESPTP